MELDNPAVFVISLKYAVERRRAAKAQLESLGLSYSFLDAVDGHRIPTAHIEQVYDSGWNRRYCKYPLSREEIGCYLSHLDAWKTVRASGSRWAVVLEDDFKAGLGTAEAIRQIAARCLRPSVVKLDHIKTGNAQRIAGIGKQHQLIRPWIASGRTTGYMINLEAAARLAASAVPFARPVDGDIKHWWEFGIDLLAVRPTLLHARDDLPSSIQEGRKSVRKTNGMTRFVRNTAYQTRFQFGNLAARLFGPTCVRPRTGNRQ